MAGDGLTGGASSGSATLAVDLTDTTIFTSTNTASRAVVRDGSGNFAAGTITATATQAQYADLAENYEADADYEPGTVLVIGGESMSGVFGQQRSGWRPRRQPQAGWHSHLPGINHLPRERGP